MAEPKVKADSLSRVLPPLRARLASGTEALSASLIQACDTARLFRYASAQLGTSPHSGEASTTAAFNPPLHHLVSLPDKDGEDDAIENDPSIDEDDAGNEPVCPLRYRNVECVQVTSRSGYHVEFKSSFDVQLSPHISGRLGDSNTKAMFKLSSEVCLSCAAANKEKIGLLRPNILEELRSVPRESTVVLFNPRNSNEGDGITTENSAENSEWRFSVSTRLPIRELLAIVPNISTISAQVHVIAEEERQSNDDTSERRWRSELGIVDLVPADVWPKVSRNDSVSSPFDLECEVRILGQQVQKIHAGGNVKLTRRQDDIETYLQLCGRASHVMTTLSEMGQKHRASVLPNASSQFRSLEASVKNMERETVLWRTGDSSSKEKILAMIETDEIVGTLLERNCSQSNSGSTLIPPD